MLQRLGLRVCGANGTRGLGEVSAHPPFTAAGSRQLRSVSVDVDGHTRRGPSPRGAAELELWPRQPVTPRPCSPASPDQEPQEVSVGFALQWFAEDRAAPGAQDTEDTPTWGQGLSSGRAPGISPSPGLVADTRWEAGADPSGPLKVREPIPRDPRCPSGNLCASPQGPARSAQRWDAGNSEERSGEVLQGFANGGASVSDR